MSTWQASLTRPNSRMPIGRDVVVQHKTHRERGREGDKARAKQKREGDRERKRERERETEGEAIEMKGERQRGS